MIKVKIIDVNSLYWGPDIRRKLEQELKDIDPEDIIEITYEKPIGYTIFYKEIKSPGGTPES